MNQVKLVKEMIRKRVSYEAIKEFTSYSDQEIDRIKASMKKRKTRPLTELSQKEIEKLYNQFENGQSISKLSTEFRLHPDNTRILLDKKFPNRKRRKILTKNEKDIVYKMYLEGVAIDTIAKSVSISSNHIHLLLKGKGIYKYKIKSAKRLNKQKIEHMIDLYKKGLSISEIAKVLNVNYSTVSRNLRKHGI